MFRVKIKIIFFQAAVSISSHETQKKDFFELRLDGRGRKNEIDRLLMNNQSYRCFMARLCINFKRELYGNWRRSRFSLFHTLHARSQQCSADLRQTEFWQFNPFARLYCLFSCILLDLRAMPYLKKHQRAYNSIFLLHSGFISTKLSTNMHICVHQDRDWL